MGAKIFQIFAPIVKRSYGISRGSGEYIVSDYLDLYDYRCRVAALYRERSQGFLAGENDEAILQRFREGRDALFAHHPQSALDETQRQRFQKLRYFPYNPALRFVVSIETAVTPTRQPVAMNSDESMSMT